MSIFYLAQQFAHVILKFKDWSVENVQHQYNPNVNCFSVGSSVEANVPLWWGMFVMERLCMSGRKRYMGSFRSFHSIYCEPKAVLKKVHFLKNWSKLVLWAVIVDFEYRRLNSKWQFKLLLTTFTWTLPVRFYYFLLKLWFKIPSRIH